MERHIELPKGWEVTTVKAVAENIQYGYTQSASNEAVGPKFLRITDIQDNRVEWETVPFCSIDPTTAEKYLLKDGDLVFARTGATVGKSFLIKGNIPPSVFASYLIRLRFPKSIKDKFVYYYFQSPTYWAQITDGQVGIGQPNVNGTKLGQLEIPLPPLPEQERIVSKIEELFSELEKGKEQILMAQQQLKTYRQAVLKWAFEGRLTNVDPAKRGRSMEDGVLPEGWEWVKLGGLMESVRNGYSKKPDEFGNFKILRISSVRPTKLDTSDVRPLQHDIGDENAVKENDLLFTRYNGSIDFVGVAARVPKLTGKLFYPDKLIRCRPKIKDPSHIAYIEYAANSLHARAFVLSKLKTTAGQTGIAGSEIKEIPIPLPPLQEQHRIVQEIESRLSVCDAMEATLADSLAQAEVLRQSILKRAFEGRLV